MGIFLIVLSFIISTVVILAVLFFVYLGNWMLHITEIELGIEHMTRKERREYRINNEQKFKDTMAIISERCKNDSISKLLEKEKNNKKKG